ncbi:TetR/AcrR family transcriptional regulator [Streptomyces spectabilis]|uniref:AcrR family transcriptional regulator n=1 Tax=Streptomyces spectabilis TaxID=68270 RepID=A0A5P2XHQ6_STRST|nr:TetR/AcrR family transcriptional regulator [Streptomyces spectabilis]MBB5104627.1 AcrR family transcriptional regulator [Streptomyces spectabilis]MCI3905020.1 TetR/AcrR family transcriptional regulator [Streptomyces spectabilis]QEV62046.1 TetR/AcrR family transcriptional regulator [Streptomyces spectabilis]GGV01174.1 TetR family transcriptional regulator [Streptomyces spectabilis]
MATKQRGRPRSFDRETALEKALRTFWEQGYETTSVSDLTRELGIGAPSLYAAFGDKRTLFAEVLQRYAVSYGAFGARAMDEEPTARAGVERMLREAAAEYTDPSHPHGCLVIHAAVNCATPEVEQTLRDQRNANIASFEDRIKAAVASGELPRDTDAAALARYVGAVLQGLSQQSRDGATREELEAVAEMSMRAWPASEPVGSTH